MAQTMPSGSVHPNRNDQLAPKRAKGLLTFRSTLSEPAAMMGVHFGDRVEALRGEPHRTKSRRLYRQS
jgi:hypothetical protein